MPFDLLNAGLFTLTALLLLGSPGPGIAALLAIGKRYGFAGGLRFYWGLQAGLAIAAALTAAGLFSIVAALPFATTALTVVATVYLVWLAWAIATAPVGRQAAGDTSAVIATARSGFILGITNPKAYLAFVSLMAAYPIARSSPSLDNALKWAICVAVILTVDIIWLWVGVAVGKASLKPRTERIVNVAMGMTILVSAGLSLL